MQQEVCCTCIMNHDSIPYSSNVVTNSLWATLPFYYIKCPIPRLIACEWHLVAAKWSHHILTYNHQNVSMALHTLHSLMACCPTGCGSHCALYAQKPHQTFITNRVWVTIDQLSYAFAHSTSMANTGCELHINFTTHLISYHLSLK